MARSETLEIFVGGALAAVVCGLVARTGFASRAAPAPHDLAQPVVPTRELRSGDLVLLPGLGLLGGISALGDGSGRSIAHCGLIAIDPAGRPLLVHADADAGFVRAIAFEPELTARGGAIVLRGEDPAVAERAAAWALAQARARTPFDFAYDDASDDSIYCTELLVKAYRAGGGAIVVPSGVGHVHVPLRDAHGQPHGDALHPSALYEAAGFHVVVGAADLNTSNVHPSLTSLTQGNP